MTQAPPRVLAYEVPDRGLPWAQALTAKLEAVARLHRVPLVPLAELDPTTHHIVVAPTVKHLDNRDISRDVSHRAIHVALSAEPTDAAVVLTPEAPERDRPLLLGDLAAMLLDAHRAGDPDHPLLTLPPGVHRVALAAQPELVHDLSGALERHMLARLGTRLAALLNASPATLPAHGQPGFARPSASLSTTPPTWPTAISTDSLARRADTLSHAVVQAEAQLDTELSHALATHGLGAVLPALRHLDRLAVSETPILRRPPPHDTSHEVVAARQALARAKLAAASLGPLLPHGLTLAGIHGPIVAALGGLALAPAASLIAPTALTDMGGPFVLAGLAAATVFGAGLALGRFRQYLQRARVARRLQDAMHDLALAERHQAARLFDTHDPTLQTAATHRYHAHLAAHRERLSPLVRKIESLASRFPPLPSDPLVDVLAPPIEPWLQTMGAELAHGEHHPPTLVALESLVATRAAEAARWQGRADVCQRLEAPTAARLEALAQTIDTLVPPGASARRLVLAPRALKPRASDHLTGFERAPSCEGLYACAILSGAR